MADPYYGFLLPWLPIVLDFAVRCRSDNKVIVEGLLFPNRKEADQSCLIWKGAPAIVLFWHNATPSVMRFAFYIAAKYGGRLSKL